MPAYLYCYLNLFRIQVNAIQISDRQRALNLVVFQYLLNDLSESLICADNNDFRITRDI